MVAYADLWMRSAIRTAISRLGRYVALGALVNLGLYGAYVGLTAVAPRPQLIMTVLYAVGICVSYLGSRSWAYRSDRPHLAAAPRYVFAYGAGYLVQLAALTLFHNGLGLPHQVAQLISMGITAGCLFLILNCWVFPSREVGVTEPSDGLGVAFLLFLATVALHVAAQWPYLFSPALVSDDLVVFPSLLLDRPAIPPSLPVLSTVLTSMAEWLQSPERVRLALVALIGVMAVQLFFVISPSGLGLASRALIALCATTSAASPSQPIFINGAHPIIGGVLAMFGLLAIIKSTKSAKLPGKAAWSLASVVAFVLGNLTSPSVALASLACVGVPLVYAAAGRHSVSFAFAAATAATPVAIYFGLPLAAAQFRYHYNDVVGHTEYSLFNAFRQVMAAAELAATNLSFGHPKSALLIASVVATASIVIGGWLFTRRRIGQSHREFGVIALLLGLAVLTFGPVAPVTFMLDRYLMLPAIFGATGLFIAAGLIWRKASAPRMIGLAAGAAIVAYAGLALAASTRSEYRENVEFQSRLIAALRIDAPKWRSGAQIIVIADSLPRNFTTGYPHWSTGFVRYASRRDDVYGLIGTREMLRDYPFLPKSTAAYGYGKQFATVSNGKTRRKKMVGLLTSAPIYAYDYSNGVLQLKSLQLSIIDQEQSENYCAAPGMNLQPLWQDPACGTLYGDGMMQLTYCVHDMPLRPAVSDADSRYAQDASGREILLRLPITAAEEISIDFELVPTGCPLSRESTYSRDYPPMPFMWHSLLRMDQRDTHEYVVTMNNESKTFSFDARPFSVALRWKRGSYIGYAVGGGPINFAQGDFTPGPELKIGRGYLDRRWFGSAVKVHGFVKLRDGTERALSAAEVIVTP